MLLFLIYFKMFIIFRLWQESMQCSPQWRKITSGISIRSKNTTVHQPLKDEFSPQSKELVRGPTELVQHFRL
jgi:hypothetical protein